LVEDELVVDLSLCPVLHLHQDVDKFEASTDPETVATVNQLVDTTVEAT
jgi:hypothetical protein